MVKRAVAILFCVLLLCNVAVAAETQKLKIIKSDSDKIQPIDTAKPIVSLTQAKSNTNEYTNTSRSSNTSQPTQTPTKKESIDSKNVITSWISDGLDLFIRSKINGLYSSFDNNSEVNQKFGNTRGALYTVITYVPNPYNDPNIKSLYTNYNALAIFFVIIFIFGEWS